VPLETVDRQQLIRGRAYAIWEEEGRPDGKALAHWLQAETEIDPAQTLLRQIRDATSRVIEPSSSCTPLIANLWASDPLTQL
jgi:Protein of unknown function (DUF2934)